jgi:hypothetical protein
MNEPSLLEWLRRTESVQVLEAEAGPYATPGLEHAHFSHHVWVSNGAQDPREWAGTLIAKCSTEQDAALIAYALSQIQDQVQKEPQVAQEDSTETS